MQDLPGRLSYAPPLFKLNVTEETDSDQRSGTPFLFSGENPPRRYQEGLPNSIDAIPNITTSSTVHSNLPTTRPRVKRSAAPLKISTIRPTRPSVVPSKRPNANRTVKPSAVPSKYPTTSPIGNPSTLPSSQAPTASLTGKPSAEPSKDPTVFPTIVPSKRPTTRRPTAKPFVVPSNAPFLKPSRAPTASPTARGVLFAKLKATENAIVNGGQYVMPPDNNVCAGNNQVVLIMNSALRAFDTDGTVLFIKSLHALFGELPGELFDPVCRYDSVNSRWIIVAAYYSFGYTDRIVSAGVYLLISDSADIKSTFKYVFVEMRDNCYNGQCFADFPTVGQDKYAVWYASFPLFFFM